jgi:putative FmdB family regulatory protein
MPLYEYECESCHNRFERIQKFSDPPVDTCPACGKGPVRKLISSPAIQFKGTGWYITDYAKKSTTDAKQAGGSTADKADKSDKSDAGAAKTESKSDSSASSSGDAAAAKTAKPAKTD